MLKLWQIKVHHGIVKKKNNKEFTFDKHDIGICSLGALWDGLVVKVHKVVKLSLFSSGTHRAK